jgi:hypothetical protein
MNFAQVLTPKFSFLNERFSLPLPRILKSAALLVTFTVAMGTSSVVAQQTTNSQTLTNTLTKAGTNKATYKSEQVLASEGVWAVFYDSKPINLKTSNLLVQYPGPKYKKVSFSNPGHAKNLAKKLNTQFKTEKFTVVLLTVGEQVYP